MKVAKTFSLVGKQLKGRFTKDGYKLLITFILFWVPIIIFSEIAEEIIESESIGLDVAIIRYLHNLANPFLDGLLYIATSIGGVKGVAVITAILSVYFLYHRQIKRFSLLIASVGGAAVANLILKGLFRRDRPNLFESPITETSFSFPSGHAMASSALSLCLVLLFWRTKWRWLVVFLGITFTIAVGISRPYFGVHYPSDIIAGWCASMGWVVLVFFVTNKAHKRIANINS